jgi:hypothetical protein
MQRQVSSKESMQSKLDMPERGDKNLKIRIIIKELMEFQSV